jgi:hypothetical protein
LFFCRERPRRTAGARLRTDAPLFKKVETLRWRGATPAFAAWAERMKAPRLLERIEKGQS